MPVTEKEQISDGIDYLQTSSTYSKGGKMILCRLTDVLLEEKNKRREGLTLQALSQLQCSRTRGCESQPNANVAHHLLLTVRVCFSKERRFSITSCNLPS